jgi:RNase P subunit RPR2
MHCMKCGLELPEEAEFCWQCGSAVGASARLRTARPTILELSCPKCAGKLTVSPEMNKLTCGSCRSELLIIRHDKTVTLKLGADERELISQLSPKDTGKECPVCGRVDQVQRASVVRESDTGWPHMSELASRLTLNPPSRPTALDSVGGAVLLWVVLSIVGIIIEKIAAGGAAWGEVVAALLSGVGLLSIPLAVIVHWRDVRRFKIEQANFEIVEREWQNVHFCHRCDRVFMPGAKTGVTAEEMKRALYSS